MAEGVGVVGGGGGREFGERLVVGRRHRGLD